MASLKHHLRHFFTPHQTNNHRPKALHPKTFFYYIFVFIVLQVSFNIVNFVRPDILGTATNITVDKLLTLTNQERKKTGLGTLTLNPELSLAAEKKAENMFGKDYWAHNGPDGSTPWDFIKSSGYVYIYAGENLAKDFQNSDGVVEAWMKSPSHRENLLRKEYQDIGFAVVNGKLNGEETTLVVQMFGAKQQASIAQNPAKKEQVQVQILPAVNNSALGVVSKPWLDEMQIMRTLSFILMASLLVVIAIDGFLILRRKTVRIAGHNLAHFIFLLALMGVVLISASGSVI